MNDATRKHYESIGIEGVLHEIASGVFGPGKSVARNEAEAWIAGERHRLDSADSAKRDSREARILEIAEEANRIASAALTEARSNSASARAQARSAKIAAIIATTAAIVSTKEEIWALIARFL